MDDQQPNSFSKGSEEEWARLLSAFNSSTKGLPGLDQDSAPVESHIASEGDGQPDATEASSNDVIRVSKIEQALRESHDHCLVKLLAAEPTTDGWMTYQESFKNLKRFISSIDSPKNKHACYLELYKQAYDAFFEYFSENAQDFKVTPDMSKALCGHAYLCQPYTLSQAEAAHLRAAKFPLDKSPTLFKVS